MSPMNWSEMINDLMKAGLTQQEIADRCGTGQSHISGLKRGDAKVPNWDLGEALRKLHKVTMRKVARKQN